MNEIVNKFLLACDKFMPEMYLRQPGFTYSVCGPFTKNKEGIQKFKETGDSRYKINEIVSKFLLAHDKFMSEMHLRQPGFTYSVCEPFTKNKERIQKFKETDSRYIYQNELQSLPKYMRQTLALV